VSTKTTLPPRLLTTEEVAEILRVCPRTLRRWVRDGKIPTVRFVNTGSGRVLFRHEDVTAFVNASLYIAPEKE